MAFKTVTYKIIGMHQDLSESAASDKYAYENMNIRIDSRNNNTMLSIENEKGNSQISEINVWRNLYRNNGDDYDTLIGTISSLPFLVIGECIIDKYIVLFGKYQSSQDIIARLEYIPTGDRAGWNMVYFYNSNQLNFSIDNPIQTVANIETEKTKKVYWVDGLNEPRIINIVSESYMNNAAIYNLTASLALNENFWVTKRLEDGYFPQGKIQYCYTYFNDTDTETNIIDYSPLFDITYKDNAVSQAATNVTTQAVFTVHINDLDTSFRYLKIYRILHTSPGTVIVTSVPKIPVPLNGGSIEYVDTYREVIEDSLTFTEDSISSKQSFIPQTLATKDNTLFFGNIKLKKPSVENINFHFGNISSFLKTIGVEEFSSNQVYQYRPSLTTFKGSNHSYKGFKKYNWYKLGFIAQYKTGEWSNVIPLGTVQCDISSETTQSGNDVLLKIPNFKYTFSVDDITTLISLYTNGFKKIKPVCVLPNSQERTVIAQGILTPTVYRGAYRNSVTSSLPFAQPSWFFRPKLLVSPVTKTVDGTHTTYKIDYAYTLRNQDDMIDLTRPNINASNWHKGNIKSVVNFNPLFREYRHAFALPPKDRINAELDSSDAISNAYFVGKHGGTLDIYPMLLKSSSGLSPQLTSSDAFVVGRLVDQNGLIKAETSEKVLLPNKKYFPTGYLDTYYIDESIFTFNSPEIDYADAIGGSAPIDLQSSSLYLNVAAAAQITSSYNNIDISPNTAPKNDATKSKFFNDGVGTGKCLFQLDPTINVHLESIFNTTKYSSGFSGYKPLMAGPWWYEWIYALGYVDKADGSDPQCESDPFSINHALAIQEETSNEHYVFRTATGASSSEFKQSWYGQLDKSSTSRLALIYSENNNVMLKDYLAYPTTPLSGDTVNYYPPIALHNFLGMNESSVESYPKESDFTLPAFPTQPEKKTMASIGWVGYGLTAAIKNKSTNWLYQYFFQTSNVTDPSLFPYYTYYNTYDNADRGALYRPNAYNDFMAKGYWPCGALITGDSDVDITVKSKYGCHIYSNSETKFPHTAFERYYPHIIYPFMSSTTPLNGNTALYKSDDEPVIPVPKVKKHTTLLYSKNTIFYNSLGLENLSLTTNINPSVLSKQTGLELLDFDWTNNIYNSNTSVSYQGIFKNSQPITYQTEHLIASLKWYRGFNTLGSTQLFGVEGIAKYLDLETFTNDVLFAGWFKPIYKKSGYLQNIVLDWTPGSVNYYMDERYNDFNYLYDTPVPSLLSIDYYTTPHIVSSYILENSNTRLLPAIQLDSDDNLEMDYNNINNQLVLEYYAKEFLKHTAFIQHIGYLYGNVFGFLPAIIKNSIYPHTGCWAKVLQDQTVSIQADNSNNTYPFWLSTKADALHYGVIRDTLSIPTNKLMEEERSSGEEPQKAFLHIGEYLNLANYKTSPYSDINIDALDWMPCGISYKLSELIEILQNGRDAYIEFREGDIYFQRYNCLKTCGNSAESEDFNAIVEHASVFVESYINLDGRYDQNRFIEGLDSGAIDKYDSTVYTGSLNPIYSKKDNYFSYKELDYTLASSGIQHFPTAILWSLEKIYGENIDSWSIIPMNNVYYADGVCGEITDLQTLDNKLYCFQYSGISIIDFNPRALIQTDTNSPISISANNAVKMQGLVYVSKDLGTYNKWTNIKTKGGMYFVDNNLKNIFRLESAGGIKNISVQGGMMVWSHKNLSDRFSWSPSSFYTSKDNAFIGYYDTVFDDVYFVNKDICLVYNEKLEAFTSFYSYVGVPFMLNYRDKFFSLYYDHNGASSTTLWEQFAGDYQKIYGNINLVNYVDLLVNDNLLYDKVFNFIEFYYNCFEKDNTRPNQPYTKLTVDSLGFPVHQISTLEASNEYQHGVLTPSMFNIKPKYRLWRAEIPRDSVNKLDRIRSPWVRLKLVLHNTRKLRQLIHTISVNYTIPIQPMKES